MMVSNRIRMVIFSLATLAGMGTYPVAVRAVDKAKAEKKEKPSTFKLLLTLKGNAKTLGGGMSFSPDGKMLVSGADTRLCLWDVTSGKLIREVDLKAGWIESPFFVLGGRSVVCTVGDYSGDIQRFDVPSLKVRNRDQVDAVRNRDLNHLAMTADGKYLAFGPGDVGIWDLENRKRLWQVHVSPVRKGYGEGAHCVSIDPRGKCIAVALDGAAIKLYAVRDGKVLRQLVDTSIRFARIGGVAFAPDGQYLAVGMGMEDMIRIWEVDSGESHLAIRWGPPKPPDLSKVTPDDPWFKLPQGVSSPSFSPDGKVVAAMCSDEKVRIWEAATGSLRRESSAKGYEMVFAPDGRTLATSDKGNIQLWDWWKQSDPRPHPVAAQSEKLWRALAAKDAVDAFRAMCVLGDSPKEAVELLRTHLHEAPAISASRLERLFADLDADTFANREKATQELAALGIAVRRKLRELIRQSPSLEVRRRAGILFQRLPADGGPEHLRWLRGVEVLEHIGTSEAEKVLSRLAGGTPGLTQTEEARAALERLTHKHVPRR